MSKRARSLETEIQGAGMLRDTVFSFGAFLTRNPVVVGGTTAFAVALSFVSANALWYQPHFHSGAFFSTRDNGYAGPPDPALGETTIRIEHADDVPVAKPDPSVRKVQAALHAMGLYDGEVDGLSGPATRRAVSAYRKSAGIPGAGEIDAGLLDALGASDVTAGIAQRMNPSVPGPAERPTDLSVASDTLQPDPVVIKVQAGLKAFGNSGIEVDGVSGGKTRAAIREFQSLFGLPVTGEPSAELLAKMREIGLVN